MPVRNSHCSWCGHAFVPDQAWPRQCASCAQTSYLNPLPVAVLLLPVAAFVAVPDRAALEQPTQHSRDGDLARLAARFVDARIEGHVGALERIGRKRAGDEGGGEYPLRREQHVEGDRGRGLGAVDQRQPLLGAKHQRFQPGRASLAPCRFV